jgi:hypothetical protein
MTDMVQIYPEDFESAMNDVFNIEYAESECEDFRIDFLNGYSLWLRAGRCVEGCAPRKLQTKINQVIKKLGIKNYVEYQ